MQKSWTRYVLIPLLVVFVCCAALYLTGLLPQSRIRRTMQTSAVQRLEEGLMPQYVNRSMANFTTDGNTETIILVSTLLMDTAKRPESVLTNPLYSGPDPNEALLDAAMNDAEPSGTYVRYWQGFRAPLRLLFTFFNYEEVRVLIQLFFLALLVLSVLALGRYVSTAAALAFAASVAAMNITVISLSIQHSVCFILSFLFILYLMRWYRTGGAQPALIFVVFGMLTQFFDFYTSPLLTFCYPFIVLWLLTGRDNPLTAKSSFRLFFCCLAGWVTGYVGMWIVKLTLVTIFTPINGFANGFGSFAARIGIRKPAGIAASYSPVLAIAYSLRSMIGTIKLGAAAMAAVFAAAAVLCIRLLKKGQFKAWWQGNAYLLFMAAVPFVWFSITSSPTYLHAYFQYRTLAITVFSALLMLLHAAQVSRCEN